MIPVKENRQLISSGSEESIEFGISSHDSIHIMSILRDQLYSDKILAVLREIGANAHDANAMAGRGHVPIKVHRNRVSDDPNTPCHFGLHVGSLEYAQSFGERVVIVRVDPEHVVCVPYDCTSQKMRVCEYEVVGLHIEGHMPSTTIDDGEWAGETDDDEIVEMDATNEELDGSHPEKADDAVVPKTTGATGLSGKEEREEGRI